MQEGPVTNQITREVTDEFIRTAFERCPSGLLVVDSRGRIVVVNAEVERLFGYRREELLNQPIEMLVPARFVAGHANYRADFVMHPGASRKMGGGREVHGRHRDGHEIDLEVGLSTIETPEGTFVLSTLVDVSERRRLEERLRQTHKLEAVGNLASGIAHDFNNILLGIIGYTELALEGVPADEIVHSDLNVVIETAKRGRSLVNRILMFSRQSEPTRTRTSIAGPMHDALQLLHATLPASIEIRQGFDNDTPMVVADAMELHQVFMNLSNNAAHAMKTNGGILDVRVAPFTVSTEMLSALPELRPGLHVRLSVSDTGHGMAPEQMSRIFEPFYTTKPSGEGTGLGLSVIARIVRALGGCITLKSEVGVGTTFDVYLPAAPAAEATEDDNPARTNTRGCVLHVEDEEALARLGKRILERIDVRVVSHTSSLQALEEFRKDPHRFDLVITDNTMPHMTGLELVGKILEIRPDIPVMMVSGIGDSMSVEELRKRGVRRLLSKPYLAAELRAAALELLQSRPAEGTHQ
jgi:PAS domain S-box-containing protein